MTLRYALSRLERPDARRAVGRTWLWVCLAGAAVTLVADGGRDFFLVLVVWIVCVFAPVRIAAELLHTVGPRWKHSLRERLLGRPDRYTSREDVALMVEWFASRDVQPPRLAPRDLGPKVIEAASSLCGVALRAGGPPRLLHAATRCASLLDRWVGTIAAGENLAADHAPASAANGAAPADRLTADRPPTPRRANMKLEQATMESTPAELWTPGASIQDQWETLRAVAGLAALTKVLVAVYEDSAGLVLDGGAAIRAEADAVMDYVDQIGLRLEGPPWEDIPGVPQGALSVETASRAAEAWRVFFAGPLPAPRRLAAFVGAVAA